MILIDTSVWVRFFKGADEATFAERWIRENSALLHPLVLGELLLGGLSAANEALLQALPGLLLPAPEIVRGFIKDNSLPGKGIGWVDAALLCSVYRALGTVLATFDEALRACAKDIGIDCMPML